MSAGNLKSDLLDLKLPQKHFGRVDYTVLNKLYAAADVVVIPSIEDSGPLMTSEVLMTGTPVVAFDTGIASELISKEYGYLATIGDSVDLASGIHFVYH